MIPTWYSARDAKVMFAGVFHYEQAMALKKYADTAMYFPYDMNYEGGFTQAEEKMLWNIWNLHTKTAIAHSPQAVISSLLTA